MGRNLPNRRHHSDKFKQIVKFFIFVTFFGLLAGKIYADIDTVNVPGDIPPSEDNLNSAVETAISEGKLSSTVFELNLNNRYILTRAIMVPIGEQLTIIAPEPGTSQETAPPQILWTTSGSVTKNYLITVNGDLAMKNIWIYFGDANGVQTGTPIVFDGDTTSVSGDTLDYGTFENCIFDFMPCPLRTASGVICIRSKHFNGIFRNCYFRNCADRHYRYYGRAVSFPYNKSGFHTDNIMFENCTFANLGCVYQQESKNYADNVHFNHCTFLNIVMYSLESGWWNHLSVTNSIFVNTYMYGDIPAQSGDDPNGGTIRIDSIASFGFEVPFSEQDRRILFTNSSYYIEKWLQDYMWNNSGSVDKRIHGIIDEIPVPQPMMNDRTIRFFESDSFPYMNKASLYDSINPGFIFAPTAKDSIKEFLWCIWWPPGCSYPWAWKPELSFQYIWPLSENLAYTNDTLLTAGMGGFPLGDLYHWFPEQYKEWEAQEQNEKIRINQWLETGKDPGIVGMNELEINRPVHFKLYQNYPNPFNPTTQINYSIPRHSYISLEVYNILGQKVMMLFEGVHQPGNYSVTFNGKGLSSGVYLYRLTAGNYTETKKLMLLK